MAIFANPPQSTPRNTCSSSVHRHDTNTSPVLIDTTNLRPTISAPKALRSCHTSTTTKPLTIHKPVPQRAVLSKKPSSTLQRRAMNKPLPQRPPLSPKAAPTCTVSLTSATASQSPQLPESETKAIPFPSSSTSSHRVGIDARSLMRPSSPTPPPRPSSQTPPVPRRRRRSSAASTLSQASTTAPLRKRPKLSRVPPVSHPGKGEALSPVTEEREEDSAVYEDHFGLIDMTEKDVDRFKCLGKISGQDVLSHQSAMLAQKVRERMGEASPYTDDQKPPRPPSPPVTPRMQNAIATLLLEHGNSYRYGPRIVKREERRPPSPLREVAYSPIFVFDDTDGDGRWVVINQGL